MLMGNRNFHGSGHKWQKAADKQALIKSHFKHLRGVLCVESDTLMD